MRGERGRRRGGRAWPALRMLLFLRLSLFYTHFFCDTLFGGFGMEEKGGPTGHLVATGWLCGGVSDGDGKR